MFINDTKEKIFFTAIDMFSSIGYSESNMRELAKRVGVKTSSLYYHYPSKDALLNEIFDYFIENDKKYRIPAKAILSNAKSLSVLEILEMLNIYYLSDETFHFMTKILSIAIGYQYENKKAKEVFDYIFYEMALNHRSSVLKELIDHDIFEPFDYEIMSYVITSYSMMKFIECRNLSITAEKMAEDYNKGMNQIFLLLTQLVKKKVE